MSFADKVVEELVNQIREWEDETGLSELIHRLVEICHYLQNVEDEEWGVAHDIGGVTHDIIEALKACLDDEDNHEEGA
jgi:hypothetical protein